MNIRMGTRMGSRMGTRMGSLDPQGQPVFVAPSEATVTILDNDGDSQLQKQHNDCSVIY